MVVKQNPRMLRAACLKVLHQAVQGDIPSFREIADRLDGRVAQAITGADGGPLETTDIGVKELARRLAFVLAQGVDQAQSDNIIDGELAENEAIENGSGDSS